MDQFSGAFREAQGETRVPESWIGDNVLVLLDPSAVQDLVPEMKPGLELTLMLEAVTSHGALFTQGFRDPSRGSHSTGSIFYPWSSVKRIRPI